MRKSTSRPVDAFATSVTPLPESRGDLVPLTFDEAPVDAAQSRLFRVNRDSAACVPTNYEPCYAYPLIVWLSGSECPSSEALGHVCEMSPQNYLGLAVDGCHFQTETPAFGAGFVTRLNDIENRIVSAVRAFRGSFHVHPHRVFLAGAGDAATVAMLVALHQAEWFAGAISFGGAFPRAAQLLAHRREVAGRRFWLTDGTQGRMLLPSVSPLADTTQQLVALGADVTTHVDPSEAVVSRESLRMLNEWILAGIL